MRKLGSGWAACIRATAAFVVKIGDLEVLTHRFLALSQHWSKNPGILFSLQIDRMILSGQCAEMLQSVQKMVDRPSCNSELLQM